MKLWHKDIPHDEEASSFAAAGDREADRRLLPYDCTGSMAHATGLHAIGILTDDEIAALLEALSAIREAALQGETLMAPDDEDCHSAIERILTERLGDTGRKIHTCRSRNDQVLCALRLCYLDAAESVVDGVLAAITALMGLEERHGSVVFAGHTHTRKAMPTTVGDWARGYIAALRDSVSLLEAAASPLRSNPLGTGAGYGLPLPTDRALVARELGFSKVDENGIYAQLSRTKHEKVLIAALGAVMYDLNRMASDLVLFTHPDFGYFSLDPSVTTGSSIMPQKTNPDILEIIRGYYGVIVGLEVQAATVAHNLISGYHRDAQLAKGAVFSALDITRSSLSMAARVLRTLSVDEARCAAGLSPDIYLTEKAYELVRQGVPFRTAYQQVANEYFSSLGKKEESI